MNVTRHLRNLLIAAAVAVPMLALPAAQAQISIGIGFHIGIAPPALPVYAQPPIPGDGYIWTPGYWAYGDAGYFWVPGTWVLAPQPGYLWTPGYWGFEGGYYGWHAGYWGPHIGYYGGVNYGFGYGGIGFCRWRVAREPLLLQRRRRQLRRRMAPHQRLRRSRRRRPQHHHQHQSRQLQRPRRHRSPAQPAGAQWSNGPHIQPTSAQMQHQNYAAQDRSQLASVNHGRPATMAAANPAAYHQVAQQRMATQPISAADRSAGKTYNPNTREANQDQRISNGLQSGQMTSGEAARADRTQSNIDSQVHNDRAANGGTLTNQERQQVNHEQNNASRQIYNENHNANTVPRTKSTTVKPTSSSAPRKASAPVRKPPAKPPAPTRNQANVDQQVHNERTANGGALTNQQHQQINQEQNHNSNQIYNQKHNNNTAKPAKEPK